MKQNSTQNTDSLQKNRSKKWVLVISGLAFILTISWVAHLYHSTGDHCDSVDPTGCNAKVHLMNDTSATLTLGQCSNIKALFPCTSFSDSIAVAPGDSHNVNGVYSDEPQPWVVMKDGQIVGCLNLSFDINVQSPISMLLSKPQSCSSVRQAIADFKQKYKVF